MKNQFWTKGQLNTSVTRLNKIIRVYNKMFDKERKLIIEHERRYTKDEIDLMAIELLEIIAELPEQSKNVA